VDAIVGGEGECGGCDASRPWRWRLSCCEMTVCMVRERLWRAERRLFQWNVRIEWKEVAVR